ncbi:MAG TPA: xanthine dehydrogenase family protein molybdopterin-binding subunit [Planctomycetota bacterium]|nr:xanthine dehydrogenase family protein molybdopterin-binding subunit [Planctomycetota bacterium]
MSAPSVAGRRDFLRASLALGGGLLIAIHAPRAAAASPVNDQPFAPNAFLRLSNSGKVTVMINKSEMGQGVSTALAMLVAEELDANWKDVGFEFAPVDPAYDHPGMPMQFTGGSTSVFGMSEPLKHAGATARAMIVAAAAAQWNVPAAECVTDAGVVRHAKLGRRATYGELASSAALLTVPSDVPLKDPATYRILGKPTRRLDTPDKSTGRAIFSIDVAPPGVLTALVAHPPVFGGKAVRFDEAAALAIPGVRKVFKIPSGVAVVAERFWAAKQGRDALAVEWEEGENAGISSEKLREEYRALARTAGLPARKDGDPVAALQSAARTLSADYELPYLAHAPMEPLNCVVDLRADSCEIWAGSQFQTVDRATAAAHAGLKPEQVTLHTTFLGGGFGRRANPVSDYIVEAVEIAKHAGGPVKLVWTREDDMKSGFYRPMWQSHVEAGLGADGALQAWTHTIVGQSILAGTMFESFFVKDGIDGTSVEGAADLPYEVPNVSVDLHTTSVGVPTLWWRSVGHSHTAFVVESFVDEIAHALKVEPIALRRKLLAKQKRHLGVLETAWKAANARPLPAGHARGIAVHFSFASYVAHVIEASLEKGKLRVHRAVCAIDCGRVVNPDTIKAQLEGAVGFALTAALYGEITLEGGRVQQSNFHDYRMLRIHEMPEVEVHIVESTENSTGVGEPGVPPVAPALCNALFQLTGKRIRSLPIRAEDLKA